MWPVGRGAHSGWSVLAGLTGATVGEGGGGVVTGRGAVVGGGAVVVGAAVVVS